MQAKLSYEMPVCEPAIIKHSRTELFRSAKITAQIDARCVCCLSCHYDKIPDRNNFKEERFKVAYSFVLFHRGREGLTQPSNSCHDRTRGIDGEMPTLGFLVPFPPSVLFQDPWPWDGTIHSPSG